MSKKYKTYDDLKYSLDKYYLEEYVFDLEEYRYMAKQILDKFLDKYDFVEIDETCFLIVFCIFLHEKTNEKIKSLENKTTSIEKVYSLKKNEKISTCCVIC